MTDLITDEQVAQGLMMDIPEYKSWMSMRGRCLVKSNGAFNRYGGRGISICDEWLNSFEQFCKDMGPRPKGMSIERINNDGDYEPGNCKWATITEQNRNRRSNKLTLYQARVIRWILRTGAFTQEQLGQMFGVSRELVRDIGNGRTWKDNKCCECEDGVIKRNYLWEPLRKKCPCNCHKDKK